MKIKSVEIYDVNCKGENQTPIWHPILVRINTDEGISGVGEAGMAYGVGHSAAAAMVKNLAEKFLIDADPMQNEKISRVLPCRHSAFSQVPMPVCRQPASP